MTEMTRTKHGDEWKAEDSVFVQDSRSVHGRRRRCHPRGLPRRYLMKSSDFGAISEGIEGPAHARCASFEYSSDDKRRCREAWIRERLRTQDPQLTGGVDQRRAVPR